MDTPSVGVAEPGNPTRSAYVMQVKNLVSDSLQAATRKASGGASIHSAAARACKAVVS